MTREAMLARDDHVALATSVYGSQWQSRLARERGVAPHTVRRWAADGISKPPTVIAIGIHAYLLSRRISDVPPTLEGDARLARPLLEQAFRRFGRVAAVAAVAVDWSTEDTMAAGAACGLLDDADHLDTGQAAA